LGAGGPSHANPPFSLNPPTKFALTVPAPTAWGGGGGRFIATAVVAYFSSVHSGSSFPQNWYKFHSPVASTILSATTLIYPSSAASVV
jgi:hypothetical protein